MLPKISIVTPTKNAEKHIPDFLKCIRGVFYPNLEVIIIDAVSTDRTIQLIHDYKDTLDVTIISEPDDGIYFAMNKGIDIATGDFILHLGADDRLTNPFAFTHIFRDQSLVDCHLIYGKFRFVHNPYRTVGSPKTYKEVLITGICHASILYRRSTLIRMGKYNTSFPVFADQVMAHKFFTAKLNIRFVDVAIASYQLGGFSSVTPDSHYAAYKKLSIIKQFGKRTYYRFKITQASQMITKFLHI